MQKVIQISVEFNRKYQDIVDDVHRCVQNQRQVELLRSEFAKPIAFKLKCLVDQFRLNELDEAVENLIQAITPVNVSVKVSDKITKHKVSVNNPADILSRLRQISENAKQIFDGHIANITKLDQSLTGVKSKKLFECLIEAQESKVNHVELVNEIYRQNFKASSEYLSSSPEFDDHTDKLKDLVKEVNINSRSLFNKKALSYQRAKNFVLLEQFLCIGSKTRPEG